MNELLELAAKAAGMTIDTHYVDGGASVWEGERHHSDWIPDWNPLDDDGDALRLAVKLEIVVEYRRDASAAFAYNYARCLGIGENNKNLDPYTATRRAIVRAAAEIGKNMT